MKITSLEMRVLVEDRAITEFTHNGQIFVEGRPGSEFELELKNLTHKRVLAIVSIDGLSIMDGQPAGDQSQGYVLNAYQSIRIPGWMLDNNQAAKFTFGSKKDSYAQMGKGNASNCGVIGVMVVEEKPVHQPFVDTVTNTPWGHDGIPSPYWTPTIGGSTGITPSILRGTDIDPANLKRQFIGQVGGDLTQTYSSTSTESNATLSTTSVNASLNNLGTSFGSATDFSTVGVEFERGTTLGTLVMFYDDAKGLKARGIVLERPSKQKLNQTPNPFPAMGCKPPKGWKG